MTRIIRQKYSGKTFTVIREDDVWLVLRPIPDDNGPDGLIAQSSFAAKWENVSGAPVRRPPVNVVALGPAFPKPEKRGRGRPKGSKNKVRS